MLYPLKFEPILKDKIWGGTKLKSLFNINSTSTCLGETWELSGIDNEESVVSNGDLAGNNLQELIEIYMGELVGDSVFDQFGHSFPLLFKLIDANDNLSIQVHPGDEVAAERHNSFGKTEMWYVVDCDDNAELVVGFKNDCSKQDYLDALEKGIVEELLQKVPVKKGDTIFIPAGLVHAIGKGIVLAEIQQSSDITYRIYDYKRTDSNGLERELHTEQAVDVIDFNASKSPKIIYDAKINQITSLVKCDYFTTNIIKFDNSITRNYATLDSFVVYMCISGSFKIQYNSENFTVNTGDTILIPACIDELLLITDNEVKVLEVYLEN